MWGQNGMSAARLLRIPRNAWNKKNVLKIAQNHSFNTIAADASKNVSYLVIESTQSKNWQTARENWFFSVPFLNFQPIREHSRHSEHQHTLSFVSEWDILIKQQAILCAHRAAHCYSQFFFFCRGFQSSFSELLGIACADLCFPAHVPCYSLVWMQNTHRMTSFWHSADRRKSVWKLNRIQVLHFPCTQGPKWSMRLKLKNAWMLKEKTFVEVVKSALHFVSLQHNAKELFSF